MRHYMSANFLACIIVLFVTGAAHTLPRENIRECFAKCRATGRVCLNIPLKLSGKIQINEDPQHDRICTINYYKCHDRCKGAKRT